MQTPMSQLGDLQKATELPDLATCSVTSCEDVISKTNGVSPMFLVKLKEVKEIHS